MLVRELCVALCAHMSLKCFVRVCDGERSLSSGASSVGSRSRSCAHLPTRSVAVCAARQHVHCTHTSTVHHVHVSIATCDVIGARVSANTDRWLVNSAFDQLDSALENRFARHFLRVCSTLLAAQRDVCDEWRMSIERETRVAPIARQQSDVSRVCGSGVCWCSNRVWHCVYTCCWSVL